MTSVETSPSIRPPAGTLLRFGAIALFIVLPLVLATVTALTLMQGLAAQDEAQARSALLERLDQRIARLGFEGGKAADTGAIYLSGDTPALARAALQQRLVAMIAETSGKLIEAQEADRRADEDAQGEAGGIILLRVAFDTRNAGLLTLLYRIETGMPLLTVRSVLLRAMPASSGEDPDPVIRVDLVVEGRTRPRAGA